MMAFRQTLLPEPVAPANSRWGMEARLATTASPDTPRPRAMRSEACILRNVSDSRTPRSPTTALVSLGTSIPTRARPGTGASMRICAAASARARSLVSDRILLTRTL